MNKKLAKKSNRGRKTNRAVLSGIKPDQDTWDEIRCRIICGSGNDQWPIVGLRQLLKNGSQLKDNPFWQRLSYDFEQAVLSGDADWFRRQAKAIEKGGSPLRARFNAKVVLLLEQAWWETLGRPENWRPLTDAEREAFPNLTRVPHVVTLTRLTPAGKFTDQMASDIYKALDKQDVNGVLVVEGYQFENKERVMDAIHDLAKHLQFELKKQVRKR